ncbi:hypothetical protein [uncultured Bacteroides sp.]|jgi:hypothetical protein|uniref:hypothetical protein n=1 Tax=uncultured Bacteroides sp. TaxID=162156 RepID=UPI000F4AC013|nr:hypothetical protein [uncultured Bacteroides sp.]ROS83538.1 hypothetical protein EEK90_07825 [Muribaculaceae bacterium Isolate-036 (Harlan)]ROS93103.1 hypothetical protein EEL36_05080 [Muribaculaceae bacterium Isolate-043 (Harlan)]
MKDHYVSYQQAIKLKELELSGEVTGKYVDCPNDPTLFNGMLYQSWNLENDEVLAPRLDQAQTWLREEKEIDVLVFNCACGYGWEISKAGNNLTRGTTIMLFDEMGEDENSGMWLSYEKALSAGIDAALKILED